jgi:hypothetical protein
VAAGFRASDKSGCPGLMAKGRHNRLNAIYELPCSPESISLTAHSEAFRKGVLVRRCVSILLFLSVLCAVSPAAAEQSPPNSVAGQVISDGKGRVGIGTATPQATLDVYQGEIKIGSSGEPCVSVLAGTLRYSINKLQLCDGTSWRNVSLDKAQ